MDSGLGRALADLQLVDHHVHGALAADLDRPHSAETETRLPSIAGGLSVALARSFKIIDPNLKNPMTEHWERAFQIFDQLL